MKRNFLIFAGAGASMAVNPEQFPTTAGFFARLPEAITAFPLFQQLVAFLKVKTASKTIDIEHVLWALAEARKDLVGIQEGSTPAGFCLQPSNFIATAGNLNFNQLPNIVEGILHQCQWLESEINSLVYDMYGYDPTADEIYQNWLQLLKPLLSGLTDRLDIFTTNYDGVIESALKEVDLPEDEYSRYLGVSGGRRKYIDLDAWQAPIESHSGLLTKLHGSVDWKRSNGRIYLSDAGFSGNHERHPIIYPGFKGSATADFFETFHEYLSKAVTVADVLIFIGFAFRDEHINGIIRDSLRDRVEVIIVDPNKSLNFCSNRARIRRVDMFDQQGVEKVFEHVKRVPII